MFIYLFVLGTGCTSTGYHTLALGTPVRLTKDILLQTQKHRAMEVCPKTEAFAGYDSIFFIIVFFCNLLVELQFFCYYCYYFLTCDDVVFSCTVVWARTPLTIPIILYHGRTVRCSQLAVIRMRRPILILCHWLTVLCKYIEINFRLGACSGREDLAVYFFVDGANILLKILSLIGCS